MKQNHLKHFFAGLIAVVTGVATAATFNLFEPATGILKGDENTYVTTAAVSADIRGLWTGTCDATTFLRGDGACAATSGGTVTSVGLTMPSGFSVAGSPVTTSGTLAVTTALNGPVRGNGTGLITGNLNLATEASGILPVANGGTGLGAYGTGALLYASATQTIAGLSDVATGNVLLSGGVGVAPSYGKVDLTTHVTGILPVANGGTNLSAALDDNTMVGNGTTWQSKALPSCTDTGGNHLNYDISTNTFSCGTSAPGGFTGFANPSATIGLSTVNGAATTAMRSDAAPALDQGIVPTWTGIHTWSNTSGSVFSMGGNQPATGSNFSVGSTSASGSSGANRGTIKVQGAADALLELNAGGTLAFQAYGGPTQAYVYGGTSRVFSIYSNEAERIRFDTDGSWDLAGTTPGTSGQVLTSNGSGSAPTWQTPSSGATITTGSFTTTWDDACTTSPTTNWNYYAIDNGVSKVVTLVPTSTTGFSCTSDSTSFAETGTSVPAAIRPTNTRTVSGEMLGGLDNGTSTAIVYSISSAGNLQVTKVTNDAAGVWTNSGTKSGAGAISPAPFTYVTAN